MSSENVLSRISPKDGVEEFFFKPLQLSHLNKFKPYILKTKIKQQGEEKSATQQPNNNKRNQGIKEGLSPDRVIRPLYNDINILV